MKRILFIGHDASRSGAPFVLLHLLRWLKRNSPEYKFGLLLLTGGELENEFRKICDVHILTQFVAGTGIGGFASKAVRAARKRAGLNRWLLNYIATRYDVVIGNTAVTLETLMFFKQKGLSVLCWMHEMNYALDLYFSRERFHELANQMDALIVGSNAVREMLIGREIDRPVHLVYEFLDIDAVTHAGHFDVRNELGIPGNAFVLGACATIEWRKGSDLFVQVARSVTERDPSLRCLWIGGQYPGTEATLCQARYDICKLGLEDRVVFVDPTHDLSDYYPAMDVFLLPSREDPFPLVCLEAALTEKPIICFQNAGGMPEFVENDCGFAVPYLDTDAAAERILKLARDPHLMRTMGVTAAAKVRARHDVSNGGGTILNIIKGFSTE